MSSSTDYWRQEIGSARETLAALSAERHRAAVAGDMSELAHLDVGIARQRETIDRAYAGLREQPLRLERLARDPNHLEYADRPPEQGPRSPDRDRALRMVEQKAKAGRLPAEEAEGLDELLRSRDPRGIGARYLTAVGDPDYFEAFGKYVLDPQGAMLRLTPKEHAALQRVNEVERERAYFERGQSLTGSAGGFAVPFELDPSILLTSAGVENPLRRISRTIPISVDEWRGVSSAGVSAAYEAELTEVAESTATLVQPTISSEKGHVFVPFSIEIGQDWSTLASELARLMADAKDTLEAVKFATGTGTNEPFGVINGTTNTVNASAGQTFTRANGFSLSEALPPRYKDNASFVCDERIVNRIRQFETTSGSPLPEWRDGAGPEGSVGLYMSRPLYQASEFPDTPGTGNKFLLLGDFSRYVIIERIGTTIEVIPHLFGTNRRPTGQRGMYCFFRNSAKVVDANAFRALIGVA